MSVAALRAAGQLAGRLLVVVDDRDLRLALVAELERHGYAATGLDSGPAALEALRGGSFDALLADLTLPGPDGLALQRAGLELDPNLAVLTLTPAVTTGQATPSSAAEALKGGTFDSIQKPIDIQTILPMLERALQVRRVRLENAQLHEAAALYELSRAIAAELDADATAQKTAAAAQAQLGAAEVAVLTLAPGDDALVVAAATGQGGPGLLGQRVPLSASLAEWLARPGEPLVLAGPVDDPRVAPLFPRPETAAAIAAPLIAGDRVVGVLSVGALAPHPGFTPSHVKALSILASAAAAALENAALVSRLRASESRYREVIEHGADGIVTINEQGDYIEANSVLLRWLGYTREEFLGRNTRDVVAPEQQADLRRDLEGLQAGQPLLAQRRLRRKDSTWLPVEVSGRRLPDGNFQAFMRDITGRQQAEDQLRFQARLLGAVGQAVIATDPAGTILYWNHMAERLYGWPADEVLGRSAATIVPDDLPSERGREIMQRAQAGESWTGESTVQRRDGSTFLAQVTNTPFYDRQGALAGLIGLSTDISESRQRQREVEAIAALSAALRGALTREQIESVILDQLMALLEADAASLVMDDPLAGDLVTEQARGHWEPFVGQRRALGQGIAGLVITTGEPYLTDAVADDPLTWPRAAAAGLRSAAAMPLIAHGQTLGALTVGRRVSFAEGDLRLLRSVADISANALQRATLHEQTRLRAEQMAAVNELARALAETLLLEQIYERLEAATRHLLPGVATVVISRYDPELGLLADVYRAERGVPRALDLAQPVDTGLIQAQAEVLATRRPVVVNPSAQRGGERASLLAPLLAKGSITGMLQAHSDGARFGPDDAELLATVANTAAVSIENARLFAETQRRLLRLQALRTIDLAITSSMDAQISLRVLVDQATTHLGVDAVDVLLLNKEGHRLELAAWRGFHTAPRSSVRLDQGLAGQVFVERRLLRVTQLPNGPRDTARAAWLASEGFVAYCGMPLLAKGLVRGVLEVFQRVPLTPDAEWIDFLETLAEQGAIAVDNSALFADLQRSNTNLELAYDTTLEGWSRALDLRDKETEGHTQRVTDLTERLARAMGLGEGELVHLRRGALLHDIGKMGIPDSILLKPGPLTDDEWAIMRKHPLYAHELLAPIPYLRPALDIPYCHHEKWDGTGYPRGLAGEQIPLAARVFAVVDVWDALRSDRPYRPAWPEAKVREHLQALAGQHFDARVVPAFMRLVGLE